eukprot:GHVR01015318.1.p1 GENE.GHVR01015318.1~~GHVR01015318.1.p1  ORF type:complete len:223 (+),score=118.60 GHVR01015318.1:2-670(+)
MISFIFRISGTNSDTHTHTPTHTHTHPHTHTQSQTNRGEKRRLSEVNAQSSDASGTLVASLQSQCMCSVCYEVMHQCVAMLPCMHKLCVACAVQVISFNIPNYNFKNINNNININNNNAIRAADFEKVKCPECRMSLTAVVRDRSMNNIIETFNKQNKISIDADKIENFKKKNEILAVMLGERPLVGTDTHTHTHTHTNTYTHIVYLIYTHTHIHTHTVYSV